jgi:hypothetical protein
MSAFVRLLSADFYFNQEVKMQIIKLLSIGLLSAAMFGCEQANEPAATSRNRQQAVPTINALTKFAALNAGYQISREVVADTGHGGPFDADALGELGNIGLCPNFVLLVQEMVQGLQNINPMNPNVVPIYTPRLKKVVACVESKSEGMTAAPSEALVFSILSDCFCDGSGSLFFGIDAFTLNVYSAPGIPGGQGYRSPVTATPYAAPTTTGYSAPSIPGYSAPSL